MTAVSATPVVTPGDRLGLTLCLAVIAHAVFVLGITFTAEDVIRPRYDTMEIALVQERTREPPDHATLLAQANLEGGGAASTQVIPATPLPPPFPDTEPAVTSTQAPVEPPRTPSESEAQKAPPTPESAPQAKPVLATRSADAARRVPASGTEGDGAPQPSPPPAPPAPTQQALPSATALLTSSFKIAALSAEIKEQLEAQAERPRRKFISANTREFRYAAYMEAWRAKVERIGNINYPDEARRRQLSGSLILDVALNPDGSVNDIVIRSSSGYAILDSAAIDIVHLAAPFAPFPDDIRNETDILHITRTWQFLNSGFR